MVFELFCRTGTAFVDFSVFWIKINNIHISLTHDERRRSYYNEKTKKHTSRFTAHHTLNKSSAGPYGTGCLYGDFVFVYIEKKRA